MTVSPDINPYHVTENTTNVYLTCMIIDANPFVTSYAWYKNGVKISTSAIYNISTVYRSHSGSYTCDATNVVGSSDITPELNLDVHCKLCFINLLHVTGKCRFYTILFSGNEWSL